MIDPDTGLNTINPGPNRTFDLLPGQTLGNNISNNEPLLFGAEEGPGIMVLGSASAGGNRHVFDSTLNARIDGLSITGADYGGGILASGYARFLQISNNRVLSNYGTYGGGVRIGHTALLDANNAAYGGYTDSANNNVAIHHNWVSQNGSTEAGAGGGITLGNGATDYQVASNYVCGNFSMADGGGIGHLGLSDGGVISDNKVIFNQTFNQSANPTGGGIFVGGEASLDGSGLSPGSGNVTISANPVQGNNAGAGAGGGVRLAQVNGLDVSRSPVNATPWNTIKMVNNIIVDNVAAYAGGGVSLVDALRVNAINNTIANNDSTGTNQESFPTAGANSSNAQPAGVVSHATNTGLLNAMSVRLRSGNRFSNPTLVNNVVWHNRSLAWSMIDATVTPQVFGLFNPNDNGSCPTSGTPPGTNPIRYVDLAVLGTGNAQNVFQTRYVGATADKLTPDHSILSDLLGANGYDNGHANVAGDPLFVASYLNGNAKPAPIFTEVTTISTAATVDEGGNFIDIRYGPLTLWNCPVDGSGQPTTSNCPLLFGDYHIRSGSPAIDVGLARSATNGVPTVDYDGANRPAAAIDIGADELGSGTAPPPTGLPALSVLDTFDRGNASSLNAGSPSAVNWSQPTLFGISVVWVNNNEALSVSLFGLTSNAYWNGAGNVFGAKQGAAFTFANSPGNNSALVLKASNGSAFAPTRYVRVRYTTGGTNQVIVETTTNGFGFTQRGSAMNTAFAIGDTLTAVADASGLVSVWKTTAASVTTLLGTVQLPTTGANSWTTGGGRIGMQLPSIGTRVDNFAGGTVP